MKHIKFFLILINVQNMTNLDMLEFREHQEEEPDSKDLEVSEIFSMLFLEDLNQIPEEKHLIEVLI